MLNVKLYDPWEQNQHAFQWKADTVATTCYASDLRSQLGIEEEAGFEDAMRRALKVCRQLSIPIDDNFRSVYRFGSEALIRDWRLSDLACYLIIVNADPDNARVAEAQVYFARRK